MNEDGSAVIHEVTLITKASHCKHWALLSTTDTRKVQKSLYTQLRRPLTAYTHQLGHVILGQVPPQGNHQVSQR